MSACRKPAVILAIILCAALAAGCGGNRENRVKIRATMLGSPLEHKGFKLIAADYMKKHPDIDIQIELVPSPSRQAKIFTAFSGSCSADIVDIHYTWFADLARKGVLENLDPWMETAPLELWDDYFPVARDSYRHGGSQYGIPLRCSAMCVIYNRDLFIKRKAALPTENWTWDDFDAAARAIARDKDGDGRNETFGFMLPMQWEWLLP